MASTHFSSARLVTLFTVCAETPDDTPILEFTEGCLEISKIVLTLGAAFGIASNDIIDKTALLRTRCVRSDGRRVQAGEEHPPRIPQSCAGRYSIMCSLQFKSLLPLCSIRMYYLLVCWLQPR